jgi:pimeloyl-ACP methyl ester carboxylesterase
MDRREMLKLSALGALLPPAVALSAKPSSQPTSTAIPWSHGGETFHLALHRQPATGPVALYVHGATFPAALSVGWRMQGLSWLDALQARGFDAWALDFAGYGHSSRPRAFDLPADASLPFGTFTEAASQIRAAIEHIRVVRPGAPISIIAHSWGTLAAQQAAIDDPSIRRLVLFGPISPRPGERDLAAIPAWEIITAEYQKPRQRRGLPDAEPTPVSAEELDRWCRAYLATDALAPQRTPPAVKVPNGPSADMARLWAGERLVDSRRVLQPTLIVRGEWDDVCNDDDAVDLFSALGTRDKRDVKIAGGNHWLHLQPCRVALWAETASFLQEDA